VAEEHLGKEMSNSNSGKKVYNDIVKEQGLSQDKLARLADISHAAIVKHCSN